MGFKEGILTIVFIFMAIKLIPQFSGALKSAGGGFFTGPTGAILVVGLFLYVLDAFLDRQGTSVPTALIQGASGIATARMPSRIQHQNISPPRTISPKAGSSRSPHIFGIPPTQTGISGSFWSRRRR